MPTAKDMLWFKIQFGPQIARAVAGTPFDLDMLTALASQETGYIWSVLRAKGLSIPEILELCVGDTIDDTGGRSAFPRNYEALIAAPNGQQMFQIAHQALVDMAAYIDGYKAVAKKPKKFCHGYGIFQYDLQFFLTNPQHFLQKRYADFDACAALCVAELKRGLATLNLQNRASLSALEMAHVAIAYNTGGFKPAKGLKQGYKDDAGRYYGEIFYDYLLKARAVPLPVETPTPGEATPPPSTPVEAAGQTYEVDVREGLLNLRKTPKINPAAPMENFKVGLPDGQMVRATGAPAQNGFLEVETDLAGAHYKGYAAERFLKKKTAKTAPPLLPIATPPAGLTAVQMPRRPGTVTRRSAPAGAHSLNEPNAPTRKGATPAQRCAELAAIIDWLAVDDPSHLRYQPHDGLTFCNIYAHDYMHLAGAYLARVWWTPGAILAIGRGQTVEPKYGSTIEEMRANGLFRWLRDFGAVFGWRQTGTLDKLQAHANQGGLALIVARRKEDGRSGHIVAVVPESAAHKAVRNGAGEVTGPLQSQAGARNARYLTTAGWWKGDQFAESAFWIHA
jgi:hypothetical protein